MAISTGSKIVKTAVFISGTGSNLKSLIKFSKLKKSPISIRLIISNNPKSIGLKYANIFPYTLYLKTMLCLILKLTIIIAIKFSNKLFLYSLEGILQN